MPQVNRSQGRTDWATTAGAAPSLSGSSTPPDPDQQAWPRRRVGSESPRATQRRNAKLTSLSIYRPAGRTEFKDWNDYVYYMNIVLPKLRGPDWQSNPDAAPSRRSKP